MSDLVVFHWWSRSAVKFMTAITDNSTEMESLLRKSDDVMAMSSVVISDLVEDYFSSKRVSEI